MKWAMKARRFRLLILIAGLASVLGTVAGNIDLPIPLLSSTTMPAPVIPSLVIAVVSGAMIQSAEMFWTSGSVRNVVGHSMLLAAFIAVAVAGVSLVAGLLVHDTAVAGLMLRDVTGFLILWAAGRALGAGRFAGLVPVIYLLLASTFARDPMGEVRGWAWVLGRDLGNPWAILTIVVGTLVVFAFVLRRRPLFRGVNSSAAT